MGHANRTTEFTLFLLVILLLRDGTIDSAFHSSRSSRVPAFSGQATLSRVAGSRFLHLLSHVGDGKFVVAVKYPRVICQLFLHCILKIMSAA